jgi:hypothetical protein
MTHRRLQRRAEQVGQLPQLQQVEVELEVPLARVVPMRQADQPLRQVARQAPAVRAAGSENNFLKKNAIFLGGVLYLNCVLQKDMFDLR